MHCELGSVLFMQIFSCFRIIYWKDIPPLELYYMFIENQLWVYFCTIVFVWYISLFQYHTVFFKDLFTCLYVAVHRPSPVATSRCCSSCSIRASHGHPPFLLLQSTGSRSSASLSFGMCMGCIVVAWGISCPSAWGLFLDQGSNLCPLYWQTDSLTLSYQRSSKTTLSWLL